jgi:hypothetical protein
MIPLFDAHKKMLHVPFSHVTPVSLFDFSFSHHAARLATTPRMGS